MAASCPSPKRRARAEAILAALGPTEPAIDHGEAPLRAVHSEDYLAFLWSAHQDWRAAGRAGDASGYAWPVVRRRPLDLDRIDARLGAYSFDASSPIAAGTWEGAYWSAQTALSALDPCWPGERAAFALCRPPGHHCGRDYLGGYCYLNNAAIAAEAATAAGAAGRDPRRRLSSRQRHPGHLLRPRRRAVRLDPRRSGDSTIRSSGAMPTRPAKARAKARR